MSLKKEDLHIIGFVHSPQGVRGQVFVALFAEDAPWENQWKNLVMTSGEEAEDFKSIKILKKNSHRKQGKFGFIIDAETISDRNKAEDICKRTVWVPKDFLISKKGETIYLNEIRDFMVIEKNKGELGPIVGFQSNGPQDIIEVKIGKQVFDIPLVEEFIEKIDFEAKTVRMVLPEGLVGEE